MSVKGIDVSNAQGAIDWHRVRADGVRFGICKVNEGDFVDKTAPANARGARAAGVILGGYDFLRPKPGRTGAQEFDIFHRVAGAAGLLRDGCMRPVADVEATRLGAADTREYVASWVERCFRVLGKHPIIYTGEWFWEGAPMRELVHRFGCALWLASYTSEARMRASVPKAWDGHPSFWQYTDKGTVNGVRGHVDMDRYLSTLKNLRSAHTL